MCSSRHSQDTVQNRQAPRPLVEVRGQRMKETTHLKKEKSNFVDVLPNNTVGSLEVTESTSEFPSMKFGLVDSGMESKTVQMICVALGAIGLIGVIICCSLPEWTVGHHDDWEYHTGLWMVCRKQGTGPTVCETIPMIPSEFHAFRALTIISCLLCGLSLLLMIFGSDFTSCVQNQDTKPKMILAAGVGLMLAGLLVIIPVSWVTHVVKHSSYGDLRAMLGVSLYIGFIAGVMLMLTGGLLCYLSRSSSSGGTVSFIRIKA